MKEDYKVADINLAEFGRREVSLAENEMYVLYSTNVWCEINVRLM